MGVAVGDALGCPVRFETREEMASHPIAGMRRNGIFILPAGSWTAINRKRRSTWISLLEGLKKSCWGKWRLITGKTRKNGLKNMMPRIESYDTMKLP